MISLLNKLFLDWQLAFSVLSLLAIVMMIVCIIFLRITLDRRVRKAMPKDWVYNCPLDWYGGWMRAIGFGYAALFGQAKRYGMKHYYNGFDVKTVANAFDKFVAWLLVISLGLILLCTIFFLVTKYLGIVDWPE